MISGSFNFSWVFKDFFNKYGCNFDNVSKNSYPRPSWNNGILKYSPYRPYSVHDVTNKILSPDSNYIVDVVMWPKFEHALNFHQKYT